MTEVPPGDGRSSSDEPDPTAANQGVPPVAHGAYPPPFVPDASMSADDVAAALAAQTAMYTGPITIPVVNSDPAFRPDPAAVQDDVPPPADDASAERAPLADPTREPVVLPPAPVPPPPPPAEYIAPDVVAADPEPAAFEPVAAASTAGPVADDELSRTVETEAAAGSTLDAILLLENELRRRQGLPPVDPADEPPIGIDAAFGAAPVSDPVAPGSARVMPPGWTPAPDPENEGLAPDDVEPQAWLTAPPPSFTPPPLVEPPVPNEAFDASALTPPPVEVPGDVRGFDPSTLPPPTGTPADAQPDFADAPPPFVAATPLTPPPFDALIVGEVPVDAEIEGIDDSDRADLVAPIPVDDTGVASVAPAPVVAAVAAVSVAGETHEERPVADPEPFAVERSLLEPTPANMRAGHAARMFWLWFAANSSFVSVAVGATLFTLGMSLRQTLVAIVAGVAISALPLGLGTLAGKWSGQPTMTVSRASFGLVGNVVPAVIAVLGRVLWGGVLLWLLAISTAAVLGGSSSTAAASAVPEIIALIVGAVLSAMVAIMGFGLLYRVQRVLGILATLLLVVTIAMTAGHIDLASALEADDGSWVLAIGGAVVVFSFVGLAWAQSSSDLARYQRPGGSGAANMLWASFGVIAPTLLILSWGALLAASDATLAEELAARPLTALAGLVPAWFGLPLLAVTAFGLLSGAILSIYSGGLAVGSAGLRTSRPIATLIAAVLVALVGVALLALGADTRSVVRDLATTLAVPVAAWAGIFASEMMIRLRRFHTPSLLARGGVYPAVRWGNLAGLVLISVVGLGFTTAQLAGFEWQGYLFRVFGVASDDPWALSDVGVLLALLLGVLLPLTTGVPAIRKQERDLETSSGGTPAVDALLD